MDTNTNKTAVSIRQFAVIVDCSHTHIWRLMKAGIIPHTAEGIPIPAALDAFAEYQKQRKRGKANTGGAFEFEKQMFEFIANLAKMKAEVEALQKQDALIEKVAADTAAELQEKLRALPGQIAGDLEQKTAADIEKIMLQEMEKITEPIFKRAYIALGLPVEEYEKHSKQPQEWAELERMVEDLPKSKSYIDSIPLEERTPEKALQIAAELEKAAAAWDAEKSLADK